MSFWTEPLRPLAFTIAAHPSRERARLEALLSEAERTASRDDARLRARAERISAWSPAEHLAHSCLASRAILGHVRELAGGGGDPGGGPSLAGWAVLVTRWIPRGAGRSPPAAVPRSEPTAPELAEQLAGLRAELAALAPLDAHVTRARGRRRHQALGALSAGEWLRYAAVHARHHQRIADEILTRA